MKKIISGIVAGAIFASSAFAFVAGGEPELGFVGYKTERKTPVSGFLKKFEFDSKESANFAEFAKSISLKIDPAGIETKPKTPIRDKRVISIFAGKQIDAKIVGVDGDENAGKFKLEISTNGVTKTYDAPYELKDGVLSSKAVVDLLDFSLNDTFAKFAKECNALHAGKTFSEAEINIKLAVTK